MPEDYFGEGVAERYDESSADMFDPDVVGPVVDFLAELAGDGAALELGVGTGRIALPLSERGVRVHGIDLSEAMVAQLREKPGGERIEVAIGDFATTRVDGTFSLAYLVFNTINNLVSQDAQVACFENVAAHLQPGGCFVIEVGVPGLRTLPPGKTHQVFAFAPTTSGSTSTTRRTRGSSRTTSFPPATVGAAVDPVPLRVAGRARPDGAPGRDAAARALERLEARAVHERQHEAHLRLGEDGLGPWCVRSRGERRDPFRPAARDDRRGRRGRARAVTRSALRGGRRGRGPAPSRAPVRPPSRWPARP